VAGSSPSTLTTLLATPVPSSFSSNGHGRLLRPLVVNNMEEEKPFGNHHELKKVKIQF